MILLKTGYVIYFAYYDEVPRRDTLYIPSMLLLLLLLHYNYLCSYVRFGTMKAITLKITVL